MLKAAVLRAFSACFAPRNDGHRPILTVHIKASNTDPFRLGTMIQLGGTGTDMCPVLAALRYLAIRHIRPGPIFQFDNGR